MSFAFSDYVNAVSDDRLILAKGSPCALLNASKNIVQLNVVS